MSVLPRCSVFNGNVLPNQPSELDATKYPNWLILYGTNSTTGAKQYIWLACSKPFLKYAEGVYVYPADADIIGYGANASTCTWSLGTITKEEGPADYYTFSGTYVWSYQPIYSHSDPAIVAHPAGDMVTDWDAEEPTITALTGAGTADSPTGYWQGDTPTVLTCTATVGDGGTLSYKWYRNGSYVGSGSNYTPSTATAGQFVYHCEVTNTLTGASGFSDVDTVQSDSMVIVVTAEEEPDTPDTPVVPDVKVAEHKHIIGYVLKQCGVPMAELIAEMLGKVKKTASLYLYGTPSETGNIGLRSGESVTYYDGAVAPDIYTPELQAQYPYAAVIYAGFLDGYKSKPYRLYISDTPMYQMQNLIGYSPYHYAALEEVESIKYREAILHDGNGFVENPVLSEESQTAYTYTLGYAVWSNFDVYGAVYDENSEIVANGELFLSASDPVPVSGLVGYSYNGEVVTAEIPEKVIGYPYVIFIRNADNWYNAYGLDTEPYTELYTNLLGSYDRLRLDSGNECAAEYQVDEWGYVGEEQSVTEWSQGYASWNLKNVAWANFDIYASDGTLYLAKSDPIPVYE